MMLVAVLGVPVVVVLVLAIKVNLYKDLDFVLIGEK